MKLDKSVTESLNKIILNCDSNANLNKLKSILTENGIAVNLMYQIISLDNKALIYDIVMRFLADNQLNNNELKTVFGELVKLKYKKEEVCQLVINEIYSNMSKDEPSDCWSFCDYLYTLRQKKFTNDYIKIAQCKKLKTDRQMIFLLMGSLKDERYISVLIDNLSDETVNGHALSALSRYNDSKYDCYFEKFLNDKRKWVRKTAEKRLCK